MNRIGVTTRQREEAELLQKRTNEGGKGSEDRRINDDWFGVLLSKNCKKRKMKISKIKRDGREREVIFFTIIAHLQSCHDAIAGCRRKVDQRKRLILPCNVANLDSFSPLTYSLFLSLKHPLLFSSRV